MNTVASLPMTADLVARLEADANEIVADWHRSMGLPLPNSVRQRVDLLREAASALRSSGEAVAWPKVWGVGRMFDNENALLVIFDRKPTDDELRAFDDFAKGSTTPPTSTEGG